MSAKSETRLCQITASYDSKIYDSLFSLTNLDEKEYLKRYKKITDRYNSLLGLSLAKKLSRRKLSQYLTLLHNKMGQPYLTGCKEHISISHCENTVIVASSINNVGVDVEKNLLMEGYELFLADDEYDLFDKSEDKVDLLTTL